MVGAGDAEMLFAQEVSLITVLAEIEISMLPFLIVNVSSTPPSGFTLTVLLSAFVIMIEASLEDVGKLLRTNL